MTPAEDESLREAREVMERDDPPRDEEEAASFQGMGQAITITRERRGLSREEVAQESEMKVAKLEAIERGELHALWGDLRRIAKGLEIPLPELFIQAEEHAPGPGGEVWRQWSGEAGSDSAIPGARSDAAEEESRE
ncbi:MAG: helix-turn-helix domain-containing protein [Solirubrobacterales bacterium]